MTVNLAQAVKIVSNCTDTMTDSSCLRQNVCGSSQTEEDKITV